MYNKPIDHYQISLLKIRHLLVERLLFGMFVLSLIAGPVSALRATSTGWLNIYTTHLLLTCLLIFIFFFKNKIPFFLKSFVVLFICISVGILGIFYLGILSVGVWWLIMSCLLINILYSFRAGLIAVFISTLIIVIAGYSFINDIIMFPYDANEYIKKPSSWIIIYLGALAFPLVFLNTISSIQFESADLFARLNSQKKRINKMSKIDTLLNIIEEDDALKKLQSSIDVASETNTKVAYFHIELNGLKMIHELMGYKANRVTLNEIADRITAILSSNDIAMRISDDQYIMILQDICQFETFEHIALEIINSINKPIKFRRKSIDLNTRIGIGIYPDHTNSATSLINLTSQAMYSIKKTDNEKYAFINKLSK